MLRAVCEVRELLQQRCGLRGRSRGGVLLRLGLHAGAGLRDHRVCGRREPTVERNRARM